MVGKLLSLFSFLLLKGDDEGLKPKDEAPVSDGEAPVSDGEAPNGDNEGLEPEGDTTEPQPVDDPLEGIPKFLLFPIKESCYIYHHFFKKIEKSMMDEIGHENLQMMCPSTKMPKFEYTPGNFCIRFKWEKPFKNGVIGLSITSVSYPFYKIALLGESGPIYNRALGNYDIYESKDILDIYEEMLFHILLLCKKQAKAEAEVVAEEVFKLQGFLNQFCI